MPRPGRSPSGGRRSSNRLTKRVLEQALPFTGRVAATCAVTQTPPEGDLAEPLGLRVAGLNDLEGAFVACCEYRTCVRARRRRQLVAASRDGRLHRVPASAGWGNVRSPGLVGGSVPGGDGVMARPAAGDALIAPRVTRWLIAQFTATRA